MDENPDQELLYTIESKEPTEDDLPTTSSLSSSSSIESSASTPSSSTDSTLNPSDDADDLELSPEIQAIIDNDVSTETPPLDTEPPFEPETEESAAESTAESEAEPEAEPETEPAVKSRDEPETELGAESETELETESEAAFTPDTEPIIEPNEETPVFASEPDSIDQAVAPTEPATDYPSTPVADSEATNILNEIPAITPDPSTIVTTAPPKKSKAPLLIILVLIFGLIGVAVWWLVARSAPEVQAIDAFSNLISADHVVTRGNIRLELDQDSSDYTYIQSINLDLNYTTDRIPESANTTLSVTTSDNHTFAIDLGQVITTDGTIYLKLDGVRNAIKNSSIPEEVKSYLDSYTNTIDAIDGQWWMISVPDVISQINQDMNANIDNKIADAYQCVIEKTQNTDRQELTQIYQQHPFLDITPYTDHEDITPLNNGNLFKISINQNQFKDYATALIKSEYKKQFDACFDDLITSPDTEESSDDYVDEYLDDVDDQISTIQPTAYVEIDNWTHQLTHFYYSTELESGATGEIDLRFSYPNETSIDEPNNAKPITILIQTIIDDTEKLYYNIENSYSDEYRDINCNCNDLTNACPCLDDDLNQSQS